ncbi:hypothetical protein K502DRAFT_368402 [Neoconidiobolus thromboides FSU 785]|nr:hypothetical protein K502DRAFT_368402 [Neoconidiobolus thromboides FSU 785]
MQLIKYCFYFLLFLSFLLAQVAPSDPTPTPEPTGAKKVTKVVTSVVTKVGDPVIVTKTITETDPEPTSTPSTSTTPTSTPSTSSSSDENSGSKTTMIIVWVVVGIASAVVFFGILAFVIRRIRKRGSKDGQFSDALDVMATTNNIHYKNSYPTSTGMGGNSYGHSHSGSNVSAPQNRLRNHDSEQLFLKQLNEP